MNITVRRGIVVVPKDILMEMFHKNKKSLARATEQVFGESLILGADETEDEKGIEYLMCSYHFREISPGQDVPKYTFMFSPNGTLVWKEITETS